MDAGNVPAIIEALDGRRQFADHLDPDDDGGLPGWHQVGTEDIDALTQWVLDNPLLSQLTLLPESLDRPLMNGVKLVLGSHSSEVRINGHYNEACSKQLRALPWPRPTAGMVRWFVIAVAPEDDVPSRR